MLKAIEIKRVKKPGYCEQFHAQIVTRRVHQVVARATIAGFNEREQAELYQENMSSLITAYQQLKRGR